MILSAQTIRALCCPGGVIDSTGAVIGYMSVDSQPMVSPFCERTTVQVPPPNDCGGPAPQGLTASYGLSACGYDVRLDQDVVLWGGSFCLASTMERFAIPDDVVAVVHDKSTWARRGVSVFNTVIEPGWRGHLTLELTNHRPESLRLAAGTPIAQVVFHRLDAPTAQPYADGKYQDQPRGPQAAR